MLVGQARPNRFVLIVGVLSLVSLMPTTAFAHCDSMDGPLIKDAQAALEKADVTAALKWVPAANADQIRQAFQKTLLVRAKGPDAQALADMYFFETLVRLHRASEGASYTGIKPAGTPMPAPVVQSDQALEQGNVDDLAKEVAAAVEAGIRQRFAAAAEARKHKDESVEAGRTFVAAYIEFVHYVERIHGTAAAHGAHETHDAPTAAQPPHPVPVQPAALHEH